MNSELGEGIRRALAPNSNFVDRIKKKKKRLLGVYPRLNLYLYRRERYGLFLTEIKFDLYVYNRLKFGVRFERHSVYYTRTPMRYDIILIYKRDAVRKNLIVYRLRMDITTCLRRIRRNNKKTKYILKKTRFAYKTRSYNIYRRYTARGGRGGGGDVSTYYILTPTGN